MKFKTSASLMIAVVLGIVTTYVGVDVVNKAKKGAGTAAKIVVAARDMEPGYVIDATDLKVEEVPASLVPAKAFKEPKAVVGRTVLASVVRGYPLIDNQLAAPGSGAGMQAMVPKGMRAVAVEVSEGSAVAGLISPGCFVDVIATFNNGEQTIATTVVQNVKVQFVKRSRPPRSSSSSNSAAAAAAAGSPDQLGDVKSVTLIVTPKQANSIELANNQGKPRLILRGGADDSDIADATVKQNELLGIADPPPPATQPAPAAVVAAPPSPPPPPLVETKVTDAFEDPIPSVPAVNKPRMDIIKAGEASTVYFDEDGDRSQEEQGQATLASSRRQPSKQPTTKPQPLKKSDKAKDSEKEKDAVSGGERGTASGASPGDPAPRAEQVHGELRKGM